MTNNKFSPIINGTIKKDVVFSPNDYFKYKKEIEGHKIPKIYKNCIICFEPSFIDYARKKLNIAEISWFRKEFKIYNLADKEIILANVNYGAPLSSIALEELIALGVKNVITIGSAGTLQDYIVLGSLIIVDSAIREEGVSYHYMLPSETVSCSNKLLLKAKKIIKNEELFSDISIGTTWTTDSFYRETIEKTKKYKSEKVLSVDMETAALYSIAKFRGIDILSIFYVSDSIANLKWSPNFRVSNSEENQQRLFDLAIKILKFRK